jgi:MraZ protein
LLFRGTFDHTLDEKHRLTIPSKFRLALAEGAVLAKSNEIEPGSPRCVSIWTPQGYEEFTGRVLASLNPLSPRARDLKRFFFNNSFDVELDKANRLMVPQPLMDYAALDRNVVVAGSGECIELWDRDAYNRYHDGVMTRIPEIAASLGDTP